MRTVGRWTTAFALMLALLAGCGTDDQDPTGDPAATTQTDATATAGQPPTPTPSQVDGARSALDAYRGMWQAFVRASRTADPAEPDLARYTQDDALRLLIGELTAMQDLGLVAVGDVALNPTVVQVRPDDSPPSVEIEDCVDTSQTHRVAVNGSSSRDEPGGWRVARAKAVAQDDGSWKVARFALYAVGSC